MRRTKKQQQANALVADIKGKTVSSLNILVDDALGCISSARDELPSASDMRLGFLMGIHFGLSLALKDVIENS